MTRSPEPRDLPLVVVPSERHIERAGQAGGGVREVWAVTSRRRLLARLWRAARPELTAAPRALVRLATKQALEGLELGRADRRAPRAPLITQADRTLAALRAAGSTAADLRQTGTERGRALAILYERVDRALASVGYYDDRSLLAGAELAVGARELAVDHRVLRIEGDLDLSAGRVRFYLDLHAALAGAGGGLTLVLPRFDEADHPVLRLAERLEARLGEEAQPFEIEWSEPAERQRSVLKQADAARVDLVFGHGPDAAARAVARAVADAMADGVAPDRIAVLAELADQGTRLALRGALDRAGVPYAEANGAPVFDVPEARTLLALVEMSGRRLDRDALVELLRTPGLHPGSVVGERDESVAIERATQLAARLARLPLSVDDDGALLVDALASELAGSDDNGEEAWMLGATERLAAAILALSARPTYAGMTRALVEACERLRLGDPSAAEIAHALAAEGSAAAVPLRSIAEGAVAVRAVRELLGEIEDAARTLGLSDAPLAPEELAAELVEGAAGFSTAMRGAAGRVAAVRVCGPRELLGLPHDRLVVLGFSVSSFAEGESTSLLDALTEGRLPEARRPPGQRERGLRKKAELAWALASSATQTLVHATVDRDGREREPPHPAFVAAQRLGAVPRVEPASRLDRSASILCDDDAALSSWAHGARPPRAIADRVTIEIERRAFFLTPGSTAGAHTGRVVSIDALTQAFGGSDPARAIAVTHVERALACPFKAFAERVLRASLEDDRSDTLSPRERGVLLHGALLAAYEAMRDLPPDRDDAARFEAARAAAERITLPDEAALSPIRRESHRRTLEEALAVVATELESDTLLRFREGERAFGPRREAPWEALAIRGDDAREVWLEGQIDRLDMTPDRGRVRVVDYKTGKASVKRIGESDLQLPLYALAARRAFPGATVEAAYLTISPGGAVALAPKKEADRVFGEERLAEIGGRAAAAVLRIWSGDVAPQPKDGRTCARCSSRPICRRPAIVPEAREDDE